MQGGMNHYGNHHRGFGGQPQPQRQGGRRGNNRGGFRNSRFEPNNMNNMNNMNKNVQPNQGSPIGQRPTEIKPAVKNEEPPQPTQPQPLKQQQQQQPPSQPQQQLHQPQQISQPQQPAQIAPKESQQKNERPPQAEQKQTPQKDLNSENQNQQNVNGGNFRGGNRQSGNWTQGLGNKKGNFGQGNKPQGVQAQGGPGPMRNQRGGPGRGPQQGDGHGKPVPREEQMLANKLKELAGPLVDLPPLEQEEVKFNGRSRLYIGNLTSDVTEEEIQNLFSAFGETAELFINKEKNFGFIKLDYRMNAEKAKRELDGKMRNGRPLRVRFAPHNSAVRIRNLPPFVSNELLYKAFEIFGKIERAYVRVDERGKTLGEGVVEYARKPSALAAIRNCTEKCFFLTSSLRPVIVENFEEPDEFDGYPEKNLPKKHPEFLRAREMGPRFSEAGSFEHEYGTRWKQLHELHRQKEEALKAELAAEEEKLEAQMEYAKYEHETEILREQLRQREQDRERQKRSWELAERAAEERREAERASLLRQEEELSQRMRMQDDELRRRQQENTLFVQAQRLNSMLDRQEQGMYTNHPQQQPMEGAYREQYDMGGRYEDMPQGHGHGWEGPRQIDDYPNKRRRF
ncbi:Hrp65 protein [Eumeta japonica]|uniref:Hrp65 protein n=1 Tax=Eumeta variegata TaxID=151549 RepID=A0A4C1WZQ7_EUMVA|nr:Hrp65 protein [Eumeta japonica]